MTNLSLTGKMLAVATNSVRKRKEMIQYVNSEIMHAALCTSAGSFVAC